MRGSHIGPAGEPVTNITISMNVGPNDRIITPINSDFIGTDIARVSALSTVATSGSYNDLIDKPTITTVSGVNDGTNWTSLTIGSDTYGLGGGGSSGEMIGLEIERLGTTTLTQELADKIAAEPYKYYLRTQLGGGDFEIYSYSGLYLNSQKMKILL